jgi:hypothetical protein
MTTVTQSARIVVLALLLGSLCIAATRLVAMRVDIEPLRGEGEKTVVEVGIQIAPEDRPVIGRQVVLQLELTRDGTTVDRVARSIELDANGRARIEVAWPPGAYDVRVEVESANGEESGLWLGKTRVPRFEPETSAMPTPAGTATAAAGAGAAGVRLPPLPPCPNRMPQPKLPNQPPRPRRLRLRRKPRRRPSSNGTTTARLRTSPCSSPTATVPYPDSTGMTSISG